MSGYGAIRKQMHEPAKAEAVDVSRCYANGCPCRASMSVEGGRWVCVAHAFAVPDRWPALTEKLREFSWLLEFIDELKVMERRLEDWRGFAMQFWANSDTVCQPDPKENFTPYENRMRGELLYRVGQMKRPTVRLPKPVKPGGFRFNRLDVTEAA
jgi:hypothetical protein